MKKERIGIFGGTFNPIHKGHVKAALEVQKIFLLDRVLLIPSYIPPHKQTPNMAPPSARLEMVERAVAYYPQFVPSPVEIEARGKSYSILTLTKLKIHYPNAVMFFIVASIWNLPEGDPSPVIPFLVVLTGALLVGPIAGLVGRPVRKVIQGS